MDNYQSFDENEPIIIGICMFSVFIIISSLMCWCAYYFERKRTLLIPTTNQTAPVVVTSIATSAPGGYQTNQMTTRSYPTQIYTQTFPVNGTQPNFAAQPGYPPAGMLAHMIPSSMPMPQPQSVYTSNPPPYDHVVGQAAGAQMHYPPVNQQVPVGPYEKPAPYNPNCPPQGY